MTDSRHFGSPRVLQFGDKTAGNQSGDNGRCAQCEAMLTDAVDGTLSAADREFFDLHLSGCDSCAQLVADARRGAAWLEMLRMPAPEPPVALLERILTQTSWLPTTGQIVPMGVELSDFAGATLADPRNGIPALAAGYSVAGPGAGGGNVIAFPRRAVAAMRTSSFGHILLQPRLAMTAAMAFFSIALTLNLTGIHPMSLRASDLQPASLKRGYSAMNARVVRYYEGLRVVYELESRVHDLQSATDSDGAAGSQLSPSNASPANVAPANADHPGNARPSAQPAPASQRTAPQGPGNQPHGSKPQPSQPAPSPGTSRREDPYPSRRLFVAYNEDEFGQPLHVRVGRTRV